MRWWLYLLAGGICYLIFTLAYFPAQQAFYWLAADDSSVLLDDVSGTIWKGSAQRAFYNNIELGSATWDFEPLSLLIGRISYEIDLADKNHHLKGDTALNILTGGYIFSNLKGTIETAKIPTLIGQPYAQLDGSLELDIEWLQVSDQQVSSASGRFHWKDAIIRKPINIKLGSLEFNLTGDEKILRTTIKDTAGLSKLEGVMELYPDGKYRINGKLKPSGTADPGLVSLLQNIGRPLTDGSTQIDFTGQL